MTGSGAAGGFNFQALVGAYVASHLVAKERLSWTPEIDVPDAIAYEQGGAGDDIRIEFHGDMAAYEVQVKRGLSADVRLEETLENFLARLRPREYGVLVVDPSSSRPVREGLRRWLDRRREGLSPSLPLALRSRCGKLLSAAHEELTNRLFVVSLDLEESSSAHRLLAERTLGDRLQPRRAARSGFVTFAQEAHRLAAQRGRLTKDAAAALLEAAGWTVRGPRLGEHAHLVRVPQRVPRFAGRESALSELRTGLTKEAPARVAVVGVPGAGKSALAAEFVHGLESQGFSLVLWHDASTEASFAESVEANKERLAKLTLEAEPNTLLVLDNAPPHNAEFMNALDAYDSLGHWSLLVTTTSASWGEVLAAISLGRFARETTLQLLRQVPGEASDNELHELAEEVSDFPLAVAQLCTYARRTTVGWPTVLARLRERGAEFFETRTMALKAYERSAASCWLLVLERLSVRAANILRHLSFFDSRELPLDLLSTWFSHPSQTVPLAEDEVDDAFGELTEWCLIEKTELGVECHSLLQQVVRDAMSPAEAEEIAFGIAQMLHGFLSDAPWESSFQTFLRLRRHIFAFLRNAADLVPRHVHAAMLVMLGNYLARDGNDGEAVDCLRQAEAMARAAGAQAKSFLSSVLNSLGISERRLGEFDAAYEHLIEAVTLIPEGNNEARAAILDNIGQVAQSRGEIDIALERYEEALALRGGDAAATGEAATSLSNIVGVLIEKDKDAARKRLETLAKILAGIRPGSLQWLPDLFVRLAGFYEALDEPRTADTMFLVATGHARVNFGIASLQYLAHALNALAFLARASDSETACWFLARSIGEGTPDPRLGFVDVGALAEPLRTVFWFNGANLLVAWGHRQEGYDFLQRLAAEGSGSEATDPTVKGLFGAAKQIAEEGANTESAPWPMSFLLPDGVGVPLPGDTPPPAAVLLSSFDGEGPARRGR